MMRSFLGIAVLLASADGGLPSETEYTSDGRGNMAGIAVGDLDGDGWPDVAQASFGNGVGVYINNRDGTFRAQTALTTATGAEHVALADFDRDGLLDIVATSRDWVSPIVLLNLGNLKFASRGVLAATGAYSAPAVIDVERDGWPDLVVGDTDRGIDLFRNLTGLCNAATDAGTAATSDAGLSDAGASRSGPANLDVGCGCHAPPDTPAGTLWLWSLCALAWRNRMRQ